MSDDGREEITRDEAKALVDECESGILVLTDATPVPSIGDVPDDESNVTLDVTTYTFGSLEDVSDRVVGGGHDA